VFELGNVVTEIRSFYSIKEIRETLEEEIEQYKSIADEYSQWLGSFLRDSESTQEKEEWAKKIATLQKMKPKEKTKPTKKGGKSKKTPASMDWIQFKEIMLSASEQSEAEILFDAIEDINRKIERLGKVKDSVEQLEKSGLGKDVTYITYICDGVPEKIVLRHREDREFSKKFQYLADFSVAKVT
jgi:glutamate mutase epsilon subunit